jgi:hypothetical protein
VDMSWLDPPPALGMPAADEGPSTVFSPAAKAHRIDEWGTHFAGVPVCDKSDDLDCIESVRVKTGGKWVAAKLTEVVWTRHRDPMRGLMESVESSWIYESATEGEVPIRVDSTIQPRGATFGGKPAVDHGLFVNILRLPDDQHRIPKLEDLDCSLGVYDRCLLNLQLPSRDYFEVTVRTSWLRNNGVAIMGKDPNIVERPIRGGTQWNLAAFQALRSYPRKGQWSDPTMPALGWMPELGFIVNNAGDSAEDSAWDPRCAEFGAPWSVGGAGRLHWVKSKRTFDFELHAPHLDPFGQPLKGDFTAEIPIAWLRCFAGKSVKPAYLSVSVVDEGGEEQAATTSIRVRKDTVFARATGFHFSSPTIQVSTQRKKK